MRCPFGSVLNFVLCYHWSDLHQYHVVVEECDIVCELLLAASWVQLALSNPL